MQRAAKETSRLMPGFSLVRGALSRRIAAVDHQLAASDELGLFGGEVEDAEGDVVRFAQGAERVQLGHGRAAYRLGACTPGTWAPFSSMGVQMKPGCTQLTRTRSSAKASASVLLMMRMAPFEAW